MPPSPDERRTSQRASCELRVRITSPRAASGVCRDVSESGMFLEVQRPPLIPVGREVHVQFQLAKNAKPIRVRATVARHEGRLGMGLRFLMLSHDEVQAIKAFVATLG